MVDLAPVNTETPTNSRPTTNQAATVARNAAAIAFATLLARGFQFLWAILLAGFLGSAEYGTWGAISALLVTASALPEFGMGLIVLRDVSRERHAAGRYLSATLATQPLLALVAHLALISFAFIMPYDPHFRGLLALAGFSLLVDSLGNMGYNQLLAIERMVTTSMVLIMHIGLQILLALTALELGGGLTGVYLATIAAGTVRAILHWRAMRRNGIAPHFPIDMRLVGRLFREGFPIGLSSFLAYAYQQLDRVLVFTVLGETAAGYLTAAFVIVLGITELLSVTVFTALFPLMSRMAKDSPATLRHTVDTLAILTFAISLPLIIAIAALARPLTALVFPSLDGAAAVLETLVWHTSIAMVASPYSQMLLVEGRQGRLLIIRVVGLAVNLAANIVFLPEVGVAGAGIAALLAQAAMLGLFIAARHMTGSDRREFYAQMLKISVAGLIMIALIYPLRQTNALLAGLAAVTAYLLTIIVIKALHLPQWTLLQNVVVHLPIVGKWFNRLAESQSQVHSR